METDNKRTDEEYEKDKSPKKSVSASTTPKHAKSTEGKQTSKVAETRTSKRQPAKQDQNNEEENTNEKMSTTPKASAKGRAMAQKNKKIEEEQKNTGKE